MTSATKCCICWDVKATSEVEGYVTNVDCPFCGKYSIASTLCFGLANSSGRDAQWHSVSAGIREQTEINPDERLQIPDSVAFDQVDASAPSTVQEKAFKLLAFLQRKSEWFGQDVKLRAEESFNITYARNDKEYLGFCRLLHDQGLVVYKPTMLDAHFEVTARGHEAIAKRSLLSPLVVFISSTCHDLLDVRSELAAHLEANGCIVRMSDDFDRFEVDPHVDSIESCLQNMRSSDVVVGILDRRYGRALGGQWGTRSATHVEVQDARDKKIPCFFFVRDETARELASLRSKPDGSTFWIQDKPEDRAGLAVLHSEIIELSDAVGRHSNWRDQFRNVVDLKKIVLKRLLDFRSQPRPRRAKSE